MNKPVNLPPDGRESERQGHGNKQAAEFGCEGVYAHANRADIERQNSWRIDDCEGRSAPGIGGIVQEYHGNRGKNAGRVVAIPIQRCEATH